MGLRFDPIGGGMFKQAVKSIIEAEGMPIKTLETRKGREEAKLKLFNEFKGKFTTLERALDELSSFKKFRELKVDLGEGANQMSVTLDKEKATTGNYELTIDELAARTSVISNNFEDPEKSLMGTGFIVLNMPNGESKELFIEEENSSLRGIAKMINEEPNFPIRASVVKDVSDSEKPWKLIMTAKAEGRDQQVNFPDFYFLDGDQDFSLSDTHEARNAQLSVDGFSIEVESNDVKDFLPGVNLHLKQANHDKPINLTITEDFQKISGKVKSFVEQMNGVLGFINSQNQVNKDTDTRVSFAGDSSLQTVEYRLRNLMHEGFGVGDPDSDNFKIYFMSDIGVEFDKVGALSFKEDKFTKFMERDFESLSQIFTGDFGFAYQMKTLVSGYTGRGNGLLAQREKSLQSGIKNIDTQIDQKQRNLERRQQSLTEQFSRLEASLGAMQRQQASLGATLGGGGGSSIQQLLGG